MRQIAFLGFAATILNYAFRLPRYKWERRVTALVLVGSALVLSVNTIQFYSLFARGVINSGWPLPVTLVLSLILLGMTMTLSGRDSPRVNFSKVLTGAAMCAAGFAFLQMVAFGKTDYTRKSDAAVVLGARVYADGTLSDAVMDRVLTACRLYQMGYVRTLIFSGGPGDGEIHETEAMKLVAEKHGVPPSAIILDRAGLNTRLTARNTTKIFDARGINRVLVVSHFYHLPRVKLAFQQEGWEVFTVPAYSERTLLKLPIFMAREAVALMKYHFDPILRASKTGADGTLFQA